MGMSTAGSLTQQQQMMAIGTVGTMGTIAVASQTTAGAAMMTTAGTTITASGAAIASWLTGAGSAIAGVLASIPVAGWIALAVIVVVVLVVVFWDDICNFFSGLCSWFTQKAKIIYDMVMAPPVTIPVGTTTDVWDGAIADAPAIPIPFPPNGLEKIDDKVKQKVIDLIKIIALEQALTRGPWNVYDLHVNISGKFNDYNRGLGFAEVFLSIGEIYKYGITMQNSVLARYAKALEFPKTTQKDIYIHGLMKNGKLLPLEWYLYRYNEPVARVLENALISSYFGIHNKFPPGNTGYY